MSTAELTALVEPGQPLFSLTSAGGGRYVAFGGGVPIIVGQEMVAALGVSGGTSDQDSEIAGAAIRSLSELTKK